MSMNRVAVLGPGGIGGLFAALLGRKGADVVCVARPETAAHLNEQGIELRSAHFGVARVPVRAVSRLDEPVDVCLVTPKAGQLAQAVEAVPPDALGAALVSPFLNGVDHVPLLRQRYPADQVVAATIRVQSTRVAPGVIEHASPFANVEIAHGAAPRDRVEALAGLLRDAGLDVSVREDEPAMLWDKLVVLAPMALITTATMAPLGTARRERRDDLVGIVREAAAVAAAEGVEIDPEAVLGFIDSLPDRFRSSMQYDAEAGRPLELDAIGGAIVRAAGRAGLEVPVTARVVAELRARV
jgi:2-dehydropantoate 2-reductase